ncbi:hypothetical protein ACWGNU_06870 [Paenibacillus lautus]
MGASQRANGSFLSSREILAAQGNASGETLEWMKTDKKTLEFNNHFDAVSSRLHRSAQGVVSRVRVRMV